MLSCVGDDVGRAYMETQQAKCQISGRHRPILVHIRRFRSFRLLPFQSGSGPCVRWQNVWGPVFCREGIFGKPTVHVPNFGGEAADSREFYAICLIPSAAVCFRQPPPFSVSFRSGALLVLVSDGECLPAWAMTSGGGHILKPNMPMCQICG